MGIISIDEQINTLCNILEKTPEPDEELRNTVVHYLQQFFYVASAGVQERAYATVEACLGINLHTALSMVPDVGPEPLLSEVFPTTGWLGDYLQHTERHEAPDMFHFWIGVSVLHAAIRRNIYFEHGYYKIFPNSYVIIVAPPGVCKKSTATNIGVELLQELPNVNIIREKITPEALIETLATTMRMESKQRPDGQGKVLQVSPSACAFIHAPELSVFLGREHYNEGLIALLTSLFDCHTKWDYTTRGAGKMVLHNLHLTLLGATTPEHMSSVIPESAMGGGLLSRVVFAAKDRSPRCEPFPVVRDPLLKAKLIARLEEISQREGQCVQSIEAMKWCEEWYTDHHKRLQEELSLAGYYERKQSHLIKLAMTLLVSEGKELIITPEIYQQALQILEFTELTMPSALSKVQKSPIGQDHDAILRHLERAGGRLGHSALLRKVYGRMDARKLSSAIDTLRQARFLNEVGSSAGREYILLPKGMKK